MRDAQTKTSADPYWWEAAPRRATAAFNLPEHCDVVVVGAGYTGLSAALTLAQAGRSVLVADRQRPGEGASSRNAGLMSGALKISFNQLLQKFGLASATAVYNESVEARQYLHHLLSEHAIECNVQHTGRLILATTRKDYERLSIAAEQLHTHLGIEAYAVERTNIREEIGSDAYFGGAIQEDISSFHPALYHSGLQMAAVGAGAQLASQTEVRQIRPRAGSFEVLTDKASVTARNVFIATNGYTTPGLEWWHRRVVPVPSQILATEEIGGNLMRQILPKGRMAVESNLLFHYLRPSPDGKRLLVGGRHGGSESKRARGIQLIRDHFHRVLPELDDINFTHNWDGFTGFTRDFVPHIGEREGIHYAIGFCGSGTVWGTWLGHKSALKILGDDARGSVFDQPLKSIPLYRGKAWFLPPAMRWYALRDRLSGRR